MLQLSDLRFEYPQELIATQPRPRGDSRILKIQRMANSTACSQPEELNWYSFFNLFKAGDALVLNDSKVIPARVAWQTPSGKAVEVLFLRPEGGGVWSCLTGGLKLKENAILNLPGDLDARVLKTGRPALLQFEGMDDYNRVLPYLAEYGEVPLPPYIRKMRQAQGHDLSSADEKRYQTSWARYEGSVAAPTAGLHFTAEHLRRLQMQGVQILYLTLHVGAGTFLPIDVNDVNQFQMHEEWAELSGECATALSQTKSEGGRVWACGTTTTRTLEGAFQKQGRIHAFKGAIDTFIQPGYTFQVVDGLLTNFHQPESTLLLLISAFACKEPSHSRDDALASLNYIKSSYRWAMEHKFQLFSYGDLTVMV